MDEELVLFTDKLFTFGLSLNEYSKAFMLLDISARMSIHNSITIHFKGTFNAQTHTITLAASAIIPKHRTERKSYTPDQQHHGLPPDIGTDPCKGGGAH